MSKPGDKESLEVLRKITMPTRKNMSLSDVLKEADACTKCTPSGLRTWEGHWYIKHEYRCKECKNRIG